MSSTRSKHTARKTPMRAKSKRTITKKVPKKNGASKKRRRREPDLSSPSPLPKKKRRRRAGTIALREIRIQQKSIECAIPRAPFSRVVREVSMDYKPDLRWQKSALNCLQLATEQFLIDTLQDANLLAIHAKRVTLQKKDMDLIRVLQPEKFPDSMHTRFYPNWHNHIPRALLNRKGKK